MDDKVTPARIAAYAARLARRVCDTAYGQKIALTGSELVSLTSARPLNLLVLHTIAGQWQAEAARLRSPYFDYSADAVQTALSALLNTLSRHIQVERATLEPLVREAAEDALGLAFTPAETFGRRFLPADDESVTPDALRANLKYVAVNKPLFEDFVEGLHGATLDGATLRKRLALHLTSHYKDATPPDALLTELNAVEPLTLTDLRDPAASASAPVISAPVVPPTPPAPKPPVAITPAAAPVEPKVEATTPAVEKEPAPVVAPVAPPKPAPAAEKPPVAPPAPAPEPLTTPARPSAPTPSRLAAIVPDAPATPLHEKFRTDKSSLNDQLRGHEAPGLAEKLETTAKVESLEKAVTINQRFTFINELFDGDREAFAAALSQLDSLPTADAARTFVTGPQMRGSHNWAGKDEHVQKLLKLIERKFAA